MSLLEVRGVTVRFGGNVAIDSLSLDVHPGEVVGIPHARQAQRVAEHVGGVTVLTGLNPWTVMGHFLVSAVLTLLARLPLKQAVGTSLLVIAMNSVSGFAGYVGTTAIDWSFLAGFTAVAAGGFHSVALREDGRAFLALGPLRPSPTYFVLEPL